MHGVVVPNYCEEISGLQGWQDCTKGHDLTMPKNNLVCISYFHFFCRVFELCFDWELCLAYFAGSLWTKRGILWGIKHRFLGFWFEKERREGYLGTLRRNEMKMEYKAFNPTDNKMNNSKPQIHH